MLNRKAFTLSELLIALAIVGAISALAIPSIVEDMNRRLLASQLKNLALTIQNLAADQLVKNKVHSLEYTDFNNPVNLLTSSNFAIADTCTTKTNCVTSTHKTINKKTRAFPAYTTRKLKNGVTVAYAISPLTIAGSDDEGYGIFYVDLNGVDKPNILGRDFFVFRITKKGRLFDGTANNATTDATLTSYCKDGMNVPTSCFSLVERNNWKITY